MDVDPPPAPPRPRSCFRPASRDDRSSGQVVAHGLAFSYWLLRITTDQKRLDMRFKEE